MKNTTDNKYLYISDHPLITYLYHIGTNIESVDRTDFRRIVFVFKDTKQTQKAIKDFETERAQVEPSTFLHDFKKIKGKLYQNVNY